LSVGTPKQNALFCSLSEGADIVRLFTLLHTESKTAKALEQSNAGDDFEVVKVSRVD